MNKSKLILLIIVGSLLSLNCTSALASNQTLQKIQAPLAITALLVFIAAYILVACEEFIGLRKSKPVIAAAGIIWVFVAIIAQQENAPHEILEHAIQHYLSEYAALFLFLLTAMTYINVLDERNVFKALRSWLLHKDLSYRQLFWVTGTLAFFISPVADNLTTALLMGSVVLAIAADNRPFVSLAFINIVVAANAGGAFSPFGDITTLMVWQSKQVNFWEFFKLFFPSLINFILPAAIMTLALPKGQPQHDSETITMKTGARRVGLLFLLTIFTAVSLEQLLHLPPFLGMMTGLSYLMFFAFYLRREEKIHMPNAPAFNIFSKVAQAEWDTLLFFFGVIFCVGGLATLGYLTALSHVMYGDLGATTANILIGILSAVIDNIPIMVAVLNMEPDMNLFQWLLVTLTVGVGGSLLSIGSAAGVALMGQSKGHYTFFSHLRWSWAIAIGYAASIGLHLLMNQ